MHRISDEDAYKYGIETRHDLMDSGERRFRLICSTDGSSYCRTVASEKGAWQSSHYHKSVSEIYVVQSGWMVYAELKEEDFKLRVLREGETVSFAPFVHHNIYLSSEAVIHTIKYGKSEDNDWYASPELDNLTQHLSSEALLSI
jgi:oxalate decarboxylase/phosphoglucose isomerase-like protein (cupin superfamily)